MWLNYVDGMWEVCTGKGARVPVGEREDLGGSIGVAQFGDRAERKCRAVGGDRACDPRGTGWMLYDRWLRVSHSRIHFHALDEMCC